MQPFVSSTSFSSTCRSAPPPCRNSSASMLTSAMSLTMTATRRPSRFLSTWFSSVVLPAPRKPDKTVTGSRVGAVRALVVLTCWCECLPLLLLRIASLLSLLAPVIGLVSKEMKVSILRKLRPEPSSTARGSGHDGRTTGCCRVTKRLGCAHSAVGVRQGEEGVTGERSDIREATLSPFVRRNAILVLDACVAAVLVASKKGRRGREVATGSP